MLGREAISFGEGELTDGRNEGPLMGVYKRVRPRKTTTTEKREIQNQKEETRKM